VTTSNPVSQTVVRHSDCQTLTVANELKNYSFKRSDLIFDVLTFRV